MTKFFIILIFICTALKHIKTEYVVPDVKLEAFTPSGLRISLPDSPGVEFFAFQGKINHNIDEIQPGDFSKETKKPENNFWVLYDPDIELKVGDVVNYWIFVQHNRLGFRKDHLSWTVKELIDRETPLQCQISSTTVNGNSSVCKGNVIFEDSFGSLDLNKWIIESYIPKMGPDFEFNSYENDPEIIRILNEKLWIKPIPKENEMDLRGTLDLKSSCTSPFKEECYHKHFGAYYLPCIRSAKIRSKTSFKYGRIDVRAKLPSGDWIYPEISLVPVDGTQRETKIKIAYSRGNEHLTNKDEDIGSYVLYAGPMIKSTDPQRSMTLSNLKAIKPFTQDVSTYSVIWEPGQITTMIEGREFGKIYTGSTLNQFNEEYVITIGVGVGGVNDFKDGYVSGSNEKPWVNRDRKQLMSFFEARNRWLPTWKGDECALQVEFVKVTAI